MSNESLLIISLVLIYGGALAFYRFFGKTGLYCYTVLATIAANIEVAILINAFGMEQTLGNVCFASTFLVTDILSENEGKAAAQKAVWIGIATAVMFILFSQLWLRFTPAENDFIMPAMREVFQNTPRIMIAGIVVYGIVQAFDVWVYHRIWAYTERVYGDSKKFLWLRNNGSTLTSQLLNSILFTIVAFLGVFDFGTLVSIIVTTYIIYIVTSLFDTPIVYIARKLHKA